MCSEIPEADMMESKFKLLKRMFTFNWMMIASNRKGTLHAWIIYIAVYIFTSHIQTDIITGLTQNITVCNYVSAKLYKSQRDDSPNSRYVIEQHD